MLNVLLAGLAVLIAVGVAVLAVKAVIRIVEALPQAGMGAALGFVAALPLEAGPAETTLAGAVLGLLVGLDRHARHRRLAAAEVAAPSAAPAAPLSPPSPPLEAPPPPEPPRDPALAHAWERAIEAAPDLRGRIVAARVGCELLLDMADADADEWAAEWSHVLRERVPAVIDRGIASAAHLDGAEREARLHELVVTLEDVAAEADLRRESVGKAAHDEFDTMRRYLHGRTRRDPFDLGRV